MIVEAYLGFKGLSGTQKNSNHVCSKRLNKNDSLAFKGLSDVALNSFENRIDSKVAEWKSSELTGLKKLALCASKELIGAQKGFSVEPNGKSYGNHLESKPLSWDKKEINSWTHTEVRKARA